MKASFLYHLTQFLRWPSSKLSGNAEPIRICLMAQDYFSDIFEQLIQGKTRGAHPLLIVRNPSSKNVQDCHLIFFEHGHSSRWSRIRHLLGTEAILTVGEADGFLHSGGMIQFFLEMKKFRFAINPDVIKAKDLVISSKLLRVAKIVTVPP
ncbi:MAG: YfiR family protein [Nitrospirales bacterium]|nr:YfiR family protein [Nitrospira sp.]MDR4502975.1 YfiR family protein [Nitrospirales bacterium]